MIHDDLPSARDIILRMKGIDDEVSVILNKFDAFTLELIAIHVFSQLFHEATDSTVVRAATFIDYLARLIKFQLSVRNNISSTKSSESDNSEGSVKGSQKGKDNKVQTSKDSCPYIEIASYIVEFLIERNVIRLTDAIKQEAPIVKKGGKYIK